MTNISVMRKSMFGIRSINKILCYVPFIWVICFFAMILIGVLKLGKIPVYGVDPDPYALSIDWMNFIMLFSFILSFISIPLNLALTLDLIARKVKFTIGEKIALVLPVLSIGFFFACKYLLVNLFEWVMD